MNEIAEVHLPNSLTSPTRYLFFTGKGGVEARTAAAM